MNPFTNASPHASDPTPATPRQRPHASDPTPATPPINSLVLQLARVFLAIVFLVAAVAKTLSFGEFEATLAASHLVPSLFIPPVASFVIALELLAAIGLFVPKLQDASLQIIALLCCVFISYSAWKWLRGIDAPCHCFGVLFTLAPYQSILLNLFLLALTFPLLFSRERLAPLSLSFARKGGVVPLKN